MNHQILEKNIAGEDKVNSKLPEIHSTFKYTCTKIFDAGSLITGIYSWCAYQCRDSQQETISILRAWLDNLFS